MALVVNNMSRRGAEIKEDGAGARSRQPIDGAAPRDGAGLAMPVLEHFAGGISTGSAHDATPGMRAGAAQVEPAHRRPVVRVARCRAQEEELLRGHLAVEDVPLGEAEDFLQVPGG